MKQHILDFDKEKLLAAVLELGEKKFRAGQISQWLHEKRVSSWDDMTNLSATLRERFAEKFTLRGLTAKDHLVSADGLTEKWLYKNESAPDNDPGMEAVLIREKREKRRTVCLSCMCGCPLGCVFCATGQMGFIRNLSAWEMIEQVYRIDEACRETGDGLTNIVFMGMGEPLLNLDEVLTAARTFTDPEGMNLGGRHITISTVGVVPGLKRLMEEKVNFRLAVSLHAPNQKIREKILPAASKWPFDELMVALAEYSRGASRFITFEYCLIDEVNSEKEHARELAKVLSAGFECKVNLIPLNATGDFDRRPPSSEKIRAFQNILERAGITATVRQEKGADIGAACGQLSTKHKK